MKVKVVPGVIRALGTPSQALEKRMLTWYWDRDYWAMKTISCFILVEPSERFLRCEKPCWHHTSRTKYICWKDLICDHSAIKIMKLMIIIIILKAI